MPDGTELTLRGLTRSEVLAVQNLGDDPSDFEVHLLSCATDTPREDARIWYEGAPSDLVGRMVMAISALSGIGEDEGKDSGGD